MPCLSMPKARLLPWKKKCSSDPDREIDCRALAFQSLSARDLSRGAASLSSPPQTCSFAVHPVITQQALSLSSCWFFALVAFRCLQLLGLRNSYSMTPRASARASSNSSMTFLLPIAVGVGLVRWMRML